MMGVCLMTGFVLYYKCVKNGGLTITLSQTSTPVYFNNLLLLTQLFHCVSRQGHCYMF